MPYDLKQRIDQPGRTDKYVLVCGLPGAGNRMVCDYVRHLGVHCQIWHGRLVKGGWNGKLLPEGAESFAIIPVRSAGVRRECNERSVEYEGYQPNVLRWAAERPFLLISYEGFCMDPESACREIAHLIGEPYQACPFEVHDGTRRRLLAVGE